MARRAVLAALVLLGVSAVAGSVTAQVGPSAEQAARYDGLHAAAWAGDAAKIATLIDAGADPNARDGAQRTPLHVAAFASHEAAARALAKGGADPNLLERGLYDIVTIAAVANDPDMLRTALAIGGDAGNVTSVYDGTALIAAAHLGHVESVEILIAAGAPLDHVNNLGWTALMEAVVLGDGGERHTEIVRLLLEAGADRTIADNGGSTPLDHARTRGFDAMVDLLEAR